MPQIGSSCFTMAVHDQEPRPDDSEEPQCRISSYLFQLPSCPDRLWLCALVLYSNYFL